MATVASDEAVEFPLTEAGDAEYFASVFGDGVRFDHRQGRWLVFRRHHWVRDTDGALCRLGLKAMRLRQRDALEIYSKNDREEHLKWAIRGESRKRIDNMLALAKAIHPISDDGTDWDTDPSLLGVRNGVLDIRTGKLRTGQPEDRITMSTRIRYDSNAACPLWEKTVSEIFGGDGELIDYVRRALGYSLTGITVEQCLFMNWGYGSNGKGTLINTVAWVLGDYADDLPFSALELHQRARIPNDVAKLAGKRFVTSSETSDDIRLNEARIKALTGCDPITARFLHREFFTFQPAAKFWLATNHKPAVRDDSYGFWRRIRLIPFTCEFKGKNDNKALKEGLRKEAPGILRWLVEGTLAWHRTGLEPPAVVVEATRDYEDESAPLSEFVDESCVTGAECQVRANRLYEAYLGWCARRGAERMSQKRFGQQIRRRFKAKERSHLVTYFGIRLRDSTGGDPLTHLDPSVGLSPLGVRLRPNSGKRVKKGRMGQRQGIQEKADRAKDYWIRAAPRSSSRSN
jgi:putative DNA primase/helicase